MQTENTLEKPITEIEDYKILVYDLHSSALATDAMGLLSQDAVFNYDDAANIWGELNPALFDLQQKIISLSQVYQSKFVQDSEREIESFDGWYVSTATSNTHLQKHHHRGHSDINCLYYVYADMQDPGPIEIYLETDENSAPHEEHYLFKPFPGALIFFPGASPHRVRPYERLRLTVATNIKLKSK